MSINIGRYSCQLLKVFATEPFEGFLENKAFQQVVASCLGIDADSIEYNKDEKQLDVKNFILELSAAEQRIALDPFELDEDSIYLRAVNTDSKTLDMCYEQFLRELTQQDAFPVPLLAGASVLVTRHSTITYGVTGLGFMPPELFKDVFRTEFLEGKLIQMVVEAMGEGKPEETDVHLFQMRFKLNVPVSKTRVRSRDFLIAVESYDAYERGEVTVQSPLRYEQHMQLLDYMSSLKLSR